MEAIEARVPMLLAPVNFTTRMTARMLAEMGAGALLDATAHLDAETLYNSVVRLSEDVNVPKALDRLAAQIETPAARSKALDDLEALALSSA